MDELREEVQIQKRGRKRRLAPGQGKGSSVSEDDEFDNATQLLLQQVKNSLTKASTPSGDVQPKQEGSSSNSSATPEPSSQESFVLPPLSTAKGSANLLQEPGKIRSGSTNASPMKTVFPSIMTGSESELINYSPRKPQRLQEGKQFKQWDSNYFSLLRRPKNNRRNTWRSSFAQKAKLCRKERRQ